MPRHLRRAGFALITSLLVLCGLEGLARLGLYLGMLAALPSAEMRAFVTNEHLVFDPVFGWRPEVLGAPAMGFPVPGTVALDGPPGPDELRVFAFGDSQAMGAGLPPEQAFPEVAGQVLKQRGLNVAVINWAMAGFRSQQVLQLMERLLPDMRADLVLVDAMANDSPALTRDYEPAFVDLRRLLFYSRLFRVVRLGVAWWRDESLGPVGDVQIEQQAPQPGPGNHELIAALGRRLGVDVVFVDYPFTGDPVRALAPAHLLPAGSVVVPTTPGLVASGEPGTALFLDNNHLSTRGSAIVGATVADSLEPILRARLARRAVE